MSERWAENNSTQLTLFAEAFPASRTPLLADEAALQMTATSGPTRSELFAQFNPDGSCSKMFPDCCPQMLDGSTEEFCGTWPRAGLMLSGTVYQRPPLAPLTDATVSGSWPTPCAVDAKNVPYQQKGKQRYAMLLGAVDPARMWPTPNADNTKWGGTLQEWGGSASWIRQCPELASGKLNPTWVEWLMGYPLEWTACAAWVTASSRKSRNGLRAASSTPKG